MARKVTDLTGNKYTRLTVVSRAENKGRQISWDCVCDCGIKKVVQGGHLKSGVIKSCGCFNSDRIKKHGMSKTKIYAIWRTILGRCNNHKDANYNKYGSRGIKVCKRWESFENFYEDMGDKPEGLSIDRKDNDKGYSKENCRWATTSEQEVNKRPIENNNRGIRLTNNNRYRCRLSVNGKEISLGTVDTLEQAIQVRRNAELKYFGAYCPR